MGDINLCLLLRLEITFNSGTYSTIIELNWLDNYWKEKEKFESCLHRKENFTCDACSDRMYLHTCAHTMYVSASMFFEFFNICPRGLSYREHTFPSYLPVTANHKFIGHVSEEGEEMRRCENWKTNITDRSKDLSVTLGIDIIRCSRIYEPFVSSRYEVNKMWRGRALPREVED